MKLMLIFTVPFTYSIKWRGQARWVLYYTQIKITMSVWLYYSAILMLWFNLCHINVPKFTNMQPEFTCDHIIQKSISIEARCTNLTWRIYNQQHDSSTMHVSWSPQRDDMQLYIEFWLTDARMRGWSSQTLMHIKRERKDVEMLIDHMNV